MVWPALLFAICCFGISESVFFINGIVNYRTLEEHGLTEFGNPQNTIWETSTPEIIELHHGSQYIFEYNVSPRSKRMNGEMSKQYLSEYKAEDIYGIFVPSAKVHLFFNREFMQPRMSDGSRLRGNSRSSGEIKVFALGFGAMPVICNEEHTIAIVSTHSHGEVKLCDRTGINISSVMPSNVYTLVLGFGVEKTRYLVNTNLQFRHTNQDGVLDSELEVNTNNEYFFKSPTKCPVCKESMDVTDASAAKRLNVVCHSRCIQSLLETERFTGRKVSFRANTEVACAICRAEMSMDSVGVVRGCGHMFHDSCLDGWLEEKDDDFSCPRCGHSRRFRARQ